ncbi:TPA: hypothetical protein JD344_16925 [Serratia marcescens]|uniref:hypothetical protein n=1 Tax=Serratia marcescens TaxID=615 RepID=UPI001A352063|nr:hypothetical protein [Serratia marcescens]HAU5742192.1 hypothetical protein [Serratia marcescens]HAU5746192.1 hypothetical protein [Serratia marcescens]HAU5758461.1 hypothetical protein [Serratia marcescens]HAU5765779.1 hypothetical protein [Serratia marcescens]
MSATLTQHSQEIMDIVSKIIIPVIVALLAAHFSTRFALDKFYKEKWWEKRLESFTEIINIAYRIKMANRYFVELEHAKRGDSKPEFKPHPKDIEDKLIAEYWLDFQELGRIAQLADFTLTTNVKIILDNFVNAREKITDACYHDALDSLEASERDFALTEELLDDLVSEAKNELRIN